MFSCARYGFEFAVLGLSGKVSLGTRPPPPFWHPFRMRGLEPGDPGVSPAKAGSTPGYVLTSLRDEGGAVAIPCLPMFCWP